MGAFRSIVLESISLAPNSNSRCLGNCPENNIALGFWVIKVAKSVPAGHSIVQDSIYGSIFKKLNYCASRRNGASVIEYAIEIDTGKVCSRGKEKTTPVVADLEALPTEV